MVEECKPVGYPLGIACVRLRFFVFVLPVCVCIFGVSVCIVCIKLLFDYIFGVCFLPFLACRACIFGAFVRVFLACPCVYFWRIGACVFGVSVCVFFFFFLWRIRECVFWRIRECVFFFGVSVRLFLLFPRVPFWRVRACIFGVFVSVLFWRVRAPLFGVSVSVFLACLCVLLACPCRPLNLFLHSPVYTQFRVKTILFGRVI